MRSRYIWLVNAEICICDFLLCVYFWMSEEKSSNFCYCFPLYLGFCFSFLFMPLPFPLPLPWLLNAPTSCVSFPFFTFLSFCVFFFFKILFFLMSWCALCLFHYRSLPLSLFLKNKTKFLVSVFIFFCWCCLALTKILKRGICGTFLERQLPQDWEEIIEGSCDWRRRSQGQSLGYW